MSLIIDQSLSVDTVRQWGEKSSNGDTVQQLTKANQPEYNSAESGSVVFDGSDDRLSGTISTPFSTDDCSIFIVAQNGITSGIEILGSVYSGSADDAYLNGVEFGIVDGKATCWYGNGTDYEMIQEDVATDHNFIQVYEFRANSTTGNRSFYINGSLINSSSVDYSITVDNSQLGSRGTVQYGQSTLKSFVFYNEYKSDADATTIRDHLTNRYITDEVAPTISNLSVRAIGTGEFEADVTTDEGNGTIYWIASTNNTTPTATQIKNGNDATGSTADVSGNFGVATTGEKSFSGTGLDTQSNSYIHVIHSDHVNNDSNILTSNGFLAIDESVTITRTLDEYTSQTDVDNEWTGWGMNFNSGYSDPVYSNVIVMLQNHNARRLAIFDPVMDNPRKDITKQFALIKRPVDADRTGGVAIYSSVDTPAQFEGSDYSSGTIRNATGGHTPRQSDGDTWPSGIDSGGSFTDNSWKNSPVFTNGQWGAIYSETELLDGGDVQYRAKFWNPANLLDPEADIPSSWSIQVTETPDVHSLDHVICGILGRGTTNREHYIGFYSVATGNNTVDFNSSDSTAPVLTNATATQVDATSINSSVDTDEGNGTLYWVVTQSATTPTATQIKNGNDDTGATADVSNSQAVSSTGTQNISPSGLSSGTTYYVHYMHEDTSNNQSNTISSPSVTTTTDSTPPTVTDSTISFSNVLSNSLTADFTQSTDNVTAQGNITYELYRASSGTDLSTLSAIDTNGTLASTDTGVSSLNDSGLSADTTYEYNVISIDEAGNRLAYTQNSVSTGDTVAPTLAYSEGYADSDTTARIYTSTDEGNGTLYWVVTQSATSPTATQVKNGNNDGGTTADASGNSAISSVGEFWAEVTGLAVSTTYYVHFMHEDGSANQSTVVTSNSFTTEAKDNLLVFDAQDTASITKDGSNNVSAWNSTGLIPATLDTVSGSVVHDGTKVTISSGAEFTNSGGFRFNDDDVYALFAVVEITSWADWSMVLRLMGSDRSNSLLLQKDGSNDLVRTYHEFGGTVKYSTRDGGFNEVAVLCLHRSNITFPQPDIANFVNGKLPDHSPQDVTDFAEDLSNIILGRSTDTMSVNFYEIRLSSKDLIYNDITTISDSLLNKHGGTTVAPTLETPFSGTVVTSVGTNSADIDIGTDKYSGDIYWVATQSSTAPSPAQVKAGQDETGSTADASGNLAVSVANLRVRSFTASGLTSGASQYIHIMQEDGDTNQSAVFTTPEFTTDGPPQLSEPTGVNTSSTTAEGSVVTNFDSGTIYAVLTQNATTPTATQIKNGQDDTGANADFSSNQSVTASGRKFFSASGLTDATQYYFHYTHENSFGDSTVVSSTALTTGTLSTTPIDGGNLVHQYDFTDTTQLTLSGSEVTAVTDQGNASANLSVYGSATKGPDHSGIDGDPITFDGTSALQGAGSVPDNGEFTVMIITETSVGWSSYDGSIWGCGANGTGKIGYSDFNNSGLVIPRNSTNLALTTGNTNEILNQPYFIGVEWIAEGTRLFTDNFEYFDNSETRDPQLRDNIFGADENGGQFLNNGSIYEIRFWNRELTAQEFEEEKNKLLQKHGISVGDGVSWYDQNWSDREKVTVNTSEVNSDLNDFPIYVNLADLSASFHSTVNADGGDIRVTKADGVTELAREVVFVDTGTSSGELHFKADLLSSSEDTEFYVYYGNSGASDYATNATYGAENVWTNGYSGVYHKHADPSGTAPQMLDSTANANHGTSNGTMTSGDLVSGKIGNAIDYDGVDDYIDIGDTGESEDATYTMSAWIKTTVADSLRHILAEGNTGDDIQATHLSNASGTPRAVWRSSNDDLKLIDGITNIADGAWHLMAMSGDGSNLRLYVDGAEEGTSVSIDGVMEVNATAIGRLTRQTSGGYFSGQIDEVRIETVSRSVDWISAQYTNKNNPTTFYTIS